MHCKLTVTSHFNPTRKNHFT